MQFSILILALSVMLAPVWSFLQFKSVLALETSQIKLDNLAIALGQRDTALLNWLVGRNEEVTVLERAHHVAHRCAKLATTALKCKPLDLHLENRIRSLHREIQSNAVQRWGQNTEFAVRGETNHSVCDLKRVNYLPIFPERCPLCGLMTHWELNRGSTPLFTAFKGCLPSVVPIQASVRLEGDSLKRGTWNYSLHPTNRVPKVSRG